ncbi:uncharacterized protein A4U43_C06F5990 [Asparagus officinalis]|uniref:Ferrochelatase n=1 Tax=Asparagus officinalis TaxID=4686 RepID=A0A5P1EJZ5_ASPOF|nr:uncharacterized protein A4U43_C06F5990 [Asparagus officinalis]
MSYVSSALSIIRFHSVALATTTKINAKGYFIRVRFRNVILYLRFTVQTESTTTHSLIMHRLYIFHLKIENFWGNHVTPEACSSDENMIGASSTTAREKVGVLLLNLGGPETLQDVQPFLFNLFADPVCDPILICQ